MFLMRVYVCSSGGDASDEDDEPPPPGQEPRWEFVDALVTPELGPLVFKQQPVSTQISIKDSLSALNELAQQARKRQDERLGPELAEGLFGLHSDTKAGDSDGDPSPRYSELNVTQAAGGGVLISVCGVKVISLVVPRTQPGWSYCFRVSAYNSVGCSLDGFAAMMKRIGVWVSLVPQSQSAFD